MPYTSTTLSPKPSPAVYSPHQLRVIDKALSFLLSYLTPTECGPCDSATHTTDQCPFCTSSSEPPPKKFRGAKLFD